MPCLRVFVYLHDRANSRPDQLLALRELRRGLERFAPVYAPRGRTQVAITDGDRARALEELVAALDRRAPRIHHAAEPAIAREAAALRAKAIDRLAELADATSSGEARIHSEATPFPARPCDVVALTVEEFASEVDLNTAPSIDVVCRRFIDDANRALVWLIRYRALGAWRAQSDMAEWLLSGVTHSRHACEVAASFTLNADWEFDSELFRSAVESVSSRVDHS